MQVNQQMMTYQVIRSPRPVLNVDLHVPPDFTGRVALYIEKSRVTCDRRLFDDEHICALDTFIEMAREAGLRIQDISDD